MTTSDYSSDLDIETAPTGAGSWLGLVGDLDADSASTLVATAERLFLQGHRHVVLDCSRLTFCDSFGLRALTVLADRVRPDGSITLASPSDMLLRLLDIVGLEPRFRIQRPECSSDATTPASASAAGT